MFVYLRVCVCVCMCGVLVMCILEDERGHTLMDLPEVKWAVQVPKQGLWDGRGVAGVGNPASPLLAMPLTLPSTPAYALS